MKLRVVRANGAPAGMREVAVRTVLRVVDNYLIGLIAMLATGERRQRIGDLAAGTIWSTRQRPPWPRARPSRWSRLQPQPAEEPAEEPAVEDAAAATRTITLPSRPTPPATLSDLTEPEQTVEEPVLEAEPVVEEPVAEEPAVEEPVIEHEPDLPDVTSPTIEGLAQDVAAARESAGEEPVAEELAAEEPAVEAEPVADEPVEDEPVEDDGPVTVRSVETVSAMDLIMGAAEEDASDDRSESAHDLPDSA